MRSAFEFVEVTRDAGVAVLALDRPEKRNAMNLGMLEELTHALVDLDRDNDVRAIVLTGKGAVFCAGADRGTVAGLEGDALARAFASIAIDIANSIATLMLRLVSMPKPIVGAINGHAVGGGLIVMLGCDLRIASRDALFWMPELGMGRAIGASSMATLVACTGPLVAKDMVLTGTRFSADDLAARGLVTTVVPAADTFEAAMVHARTLASAPVEALSTAKARANAGLIGIWRGAVEVPEVARPRPAAG